MLPKIWFNTAWCLVANNDRLSSSAGNFRSCRVPLPLALAVSGALAGVGRESSPPHGRVFFGWWPRNEAHFLRLCSSGSSHSPSSPQAVGHRGGGGGSSNLPRQLIALFFHARQADTRAAFPSQTTAWLLASRLRPRIRTSMSGRPHQSNTRSPAFNARTTLLLPSATRENPAARPVPAPWESSSQPESHCPSAARTGLREALAACLSCLGLFMWKEGTVRDSLVKGVSEETRILNPNSLVLRLKLRVHVSMEDILALIIEAHVLGDSSCRLLNTPRDAPSHDIQVIKDDARRHDFLCIWRQKTELTDESRVKKKQNTTSASDGGVPEVASVFLFLHYSEESVPVVGEIADAASHLLLGYVSLMQGCRYCRNKGVPLFLVPQMLSRTAVTQKLMAGRCLHTFTVSWTFGVKTRLDNVLHERISLSVSQRMKRRVRDANKSQNPRHTWMR